MLESFRRLLGLGTAESAASVPTFAKIQKELGLQRVNLRECMGAYVSDQNTEGFSIKERFAALEAHFIGNIWQTTHAWIDDHRSTHGFCETNIPDLEPYLKKFPIIDRQIPDHARSLQISPISEQEWEDLRQAIAVCPEGAENLLRPCITRVLDFFLVWWESQRKENFKTRSGWDEPENRMYRQYMDLLTDNLPQSLACRFPVTLKMLEGYRFGTSVFLRTSREQDNIHIDRAANTHLVVVEHMVDNLRSGAHSETKAVMDLLKSMGEMRKVRTKRAHQINMEDQITGCPAYFTPAFDGIRSWINGIRDDLMPT